jgi:hypothetical protein
MGGDDGERKILVEILLGGGSVEDEMKDLAFAISIHRYSVLR